MTKAIKVDLITENICLEDHKDTLFVEEFPDGTPFTVVAEGDYVRHGKFYRTVKKVYKIYRVRKRDGSIINYLLQQNDAEMFNDLIQISNDELETIKRNHAEKEVKKVLNSGKYVTVELMEDRVKSKVNDIKTLSWWKKILNKF